MLSLSGSSLLLAQQINPKPTPAPTGLALIEQAYREGRISLDQKVLYQLYAVNSPDRLPEDLRSGFTRPLKCGTPVYLEYQRFSAKLQPATLAEIESLRRPKSVMQAQETYLSPSGKFLIHYSTSGEDSVSVSDSSGSGTPDYVEWVAAAADSSWRHEVQNLSYTDPVTANTNPYPIYIEQTNVYGYTDYGYKRGYEGSTFIVINNNFQGFPPNTDPEGHVRGAIKATMAHELKHAIQYAATRWSGESDRWAEMDATLMEEVVYDNVNDYYNYISSTSLSPIFLYPERSFYPGSYEHITWALYFEEKYGSGFWADVWDQLKTAPDSLQMIEAMQSVLGENNSFSGNLVESHLWHYAAGPERSPDDYGFEERLEYPDPRLNTIFFGLDSLTTPTSVEPLAANYLEVNPTLTIPGYVRIVLTRSTPDINMGLIGYFSDGSTEQIITAGGNTLVVPEQTTWEWSDLDRLGIVITNGNQDRSGTYEIRVITDIPDEITLSQNYPNPFYPGTTIPFTLNAESRVQLKVYDVLGRLVRTLIDDTLPGGFYAPEFQAADLASGVYIYQLITDEKVLTKKMTVVK